MKAGADLQKFRDSGEKFDPAKHGLSLNRALLKALGEKEPDALKAYLRAVVRHKATSEIKQDVWSKGAKHLGL